MPRRDTSHHARCAIMDLASMGLAEINLGRRGFGGLLLAGLLLVGGCAGQAPVAGTMGQDEIDRMFDGLIESLVTDRAPDMATDMAPDMFADRMDHHPGAGMSIEMLLELYNKSTAAQDWQRLPDMLSPVTPSAF
ncbi:hypothetical protein AB3X55_07555 [Alphaproteobacteria bacterium LSUCC0719]